MSKINCNQCNRSFIKKKTTKNNTCGICHAKNKRLAEQQVNLETERYKRFCPLCNSKIVYKNKRRYLKALDKNCKCKKCTAVKQFKNLDQEIKAGLRENGFKGKKHSKETKERLKNLDKSYLSKLDYSWVLKGKDHPMYGKSLYDIWLEKYDKAEADKRLVEFKAKISKTSKGSNNPMYGRPSPQGSGNGWSGWYKNVYFRSFLELSFLVNWVNRFDLDIESAEKKKYKIPYKYNSSDRNYFADWFVNDKYLVEIKPKRLWNTPQNLAKFKAAKQYCNENNLIFKLIEPIKLSKEEIKSLHETNSIKFNSKYEEKFKNY